MVSRAIFGAALIAGFSYMVPVLGGMSGPDVTLWKGAGVTLLAIWCALQARSVGGWLITAVMAFGALGDVLLDLAGFTVGGLAFAIGHVLAIVLYLRNGRPRLTSSQRLLGLLVVPLSVFVAAAMVPAASTVPVAAYALFVSAMAATAWISRFPRYRTGLGAMMFLASDLFIFARMGPLAGSSLPHLLIWPLYFGGQALIAAGVVRTLRSDAIGNAP